MVHSSALFSAVTGDGTFGTQSGNFLTRPRVSQNTKWLMNCIANSSHCAMNWKSTISCADSGERNGILRAIRDFHMRTPISFRQFNPRTDRDYIHITGENTGCWSYVGRIGGVSNRVKGVVKTRPALRIAKLLLCILPHHTNPHCFISYSRPPPSCEKIGNIVSDLEWLSHKPAVISPKIKWWTPTWIYRLGNIYVYTQECV